MTTYRARDEASEEQTDAWILAHPWTIQATVQHGDARGRTIGFPTANMYVDDEALVPFGIYAVRVKIVDEGGTVVTALHDGVASFGIRPMFQTPRPILEAHLFDFSGDLYGRDLIVEFVAWLRPEAAFSSLTTLAEQIRQDVIEARAILRRHI